MNVNAFVTKHVQTKPQFINLKDMFRSGNENVNITIYS